MAHIVNNSISDEYENKNDFPLQDMEVYRKSEVQNEQKESSDDLKKENDRIKKEKIKENSLPIRKEVKNQRNFRIKDYGVIYFYLFIKEIT